MQVVSVIGQCQILMKKVIWLGNFLLQEMTKASKNVGRLDGNLLDGAGQLDGAG